MGESHPEASCRPDGGSLFRPLYRSGWLREGRLTDKSIRRIIARRGKAAGVGGRVSGHSLRVGGAQGQIEQQGAVARLRYGK